MKDFIGYSRFVFLGGFFLLLIILSSETVRGATLSSLDVTPADSTINVSQTQPFTVTGHYSDGSSRTLSLGNHIATGGFHTCAVLYDGTVLCWGDNTFGQLGTVTADPLVNPSGQSTPVFVSGISSATAIAAGPDRTCAVLSDGTVKCWGNNEYGALGNGTAMGPDCGGYCSITPVTVSGISTATAIALGPFHTCALLSDSTVKCWGDNYYGQLGNGVHTDSGTPVSVSGISTATAIAAGNGYTCVLLSNGTVNCWGRNRYGQLGDGKSGTSDINNSDTPVPVIGITTATAITAEGEHTCAVLSDGTIKCWGQNDAGGLGDGTTVSKSIPVSVSGISTAVAVDAGKYHTCAQLSDGTVQCWGFNFHGQLGKGSFPDSYTPVPVWYISTAAAIAAGGDDTCAILSDGTVQCWGQNDTGALGDGSTTNFYQPVPVIGISTGIFTATAVATGDNHTCVVLSDGTVKCWGKNDLGQLGDGYINGTDPACSGLCNPMPVSVIGISTATAVATGLSHTCAVLSDGTMKCWGGDSVGQLGNGFTGLASPPVSVSGISTATAVTAGRLHTCAQLSDGTVKCWGSNAFGQLGNGSMTDSSTPVTVSGISTATAVASGEYDTCAVLSDGAVKCWGENSLGQLGNGTFSGPETCLFSGIPSSCSTTPVAVSGISTARAVAAGLQHTCAVLSDGTVECWGFNSSGQLGNGTFAGPETCLINGTPVSCSTTPVTVSGISTATAVTGGLQHTCAALSDGTIECWGSDLHGQLGTEPPATSSIPVTVSGISTATAVAGGEYQTCAVLSDGTVKCWGNNTNGQLGNGTTTDSFTPVTAGATVNSVVLTSSDTGVAPINANGVATGFSPGTTAITATSGSISGSTTLTVSVPTFTLTQSPITMGIGGSASSSVMISSINGFSSPVTLSVSGIPAGVTASFSSNPVTPPAGGSVSSTLTLSLSPLVPPSTFTLTVMGTSGSLTPATTATVTVITSSSSITNVIEQLLTLGSINNSGIANALTSKLSSAQTAINGGNLQAAINILTAFINQAQAQSGKHIASSAATVLVMDATALLDTLKVTMTPNPITGYIINSSGLDLSGVTISIINNSQIVAATATTDITGFYYFATTGVLSVGSAYSVQVSTFPSGYTSSSPASQSMTWQGASVTLDDFILSP